MLPFKANYSYKLKRVYLKVKERIEKLIDIYKGLYKIAKVV